MALFNLFGKQKDNQPAKAESTADTTSNADNKAEAPATQADSGQQVTEQAAITPQAQPQQKPSSGGFFARVRQGLTRTRSQLGDGVADLFMGTKTIDDDLFEELETQLLMADIGVEATSAIMTELAATVARKDLQDPQALYAALRECLTNTRLLWNILRNIMTTDQVLLLILVTAQVRAIIGLRTIIRWKCCSWMN